jgi:hypothetical protein
VVCSALVPHHMPTGSTMPQNLCSRLQHGWLPAGHTSFATTAGEYIAPESIVSQVVQPGSELFVRLSRVHTCTSPSPGGARSMRCMSHHPLTSRHRSPSAADTDRSVF